MSVHIDDLTRNARSILLNSSSVVNGLPVCGISFRFGRKNEIRKEYLGTGF